MNLLSEAALLAEVEWLRGLVECRSISLPGGLRVERDTPESWALRSLHGETRRFDTVWDALTAAREKEATE